MKKLPMLWFCFSMVLCSMNAYSQGLETPIRVYSQRLETPIKIVHPDFSGTWNLNFLKSELKDMASKGLSDEQMILTVDQKLPVISVQVTVRHQGKSGTGREFKIYTDGRASEVPAAHTASGGIAEWSGNKLVITVVASPKDRNVLVVEVELSADGITMISTLKRALTRTGPDGTSITVVDNTRTMTMIYDRIVDVPARSNKTPRPEEK
jgi:hypothetical protein